MWKVILGALLSLLLYAPYAEAVVIFQDTFTGTDNTQLPSHTPNTGTSWTVVQQSAANELTIQGNEASGSASSTGYEIASADVTYPSANYNVIGIMGATVLNIVNPRALWLGCRYANNGGIDGYFAAIVSGDNTNDVRIYRADDGVATKISGTEDYNNVAAGDTITLECKGSAIGLKVNGSYVINPIADATYSTGVAAIGTGEILGLTEFASPGSEIDFTTFTVDTIIGDTNRTLLGVGQ